MAEHLGVLAAGETLSAEDQTLILARLNLVAKAMGGRVDMGRGTKPWVRQRVTLFVAKGQQTYLVGPASSDARASTQYGKTTISANEASGQTVLSITSNTDTTTYPGTTVTMTASDIVGIEQNDDTIHWTTISGTPGATMTISVALTAAADAGRYVYWFTSRAQRFVEIEAATLLDENRIETPLDVYRELADYQLGVTDKYADGDPSCILVEPLRIATRITLNSQPTDVTKQIQLTVLYPNEDYDAAANDIAFPQEWLDYLTWQVAKRSAVAFGTNWTALMESNLGEAKMMAHSLNPEMSNAQFYVGSL